MRPAAPPSIIAKFATPIEGNRAIAMAFRMYEREINFYRRIAPTVGVAAPLSYAGEVDPESGDCVLLMEDLSGYDTGDQVVGCTAEEAKTIIDAVVPLHAAFFNKTDSPLLEGVPRMDGETQILGITAACAAGWDPTMAMFGHGVAQEIKDAKEQFVAAVPELHRMLCRGDTERDPRGPPPRQPDVRQATGAEAGGAAGLVVVDLHATAGHGLPDQPERAA